MNSTHRVLTVFSTCVLLLAGTQFRNAVSSAETPFTVHLSIPAEEIQLGDIFFAKLVFENRSADAVMCRYTSPTHNLRITLDSKSPFENDVDVHFHGWVGSGCRAFPGRYFKGNEVYSEIVVLRAVTAELLFGPAPRPRDPDEHLKATIHFEFDLELIWGNGRLTWTSPFPEPTKSKVQQTIRLKYVERPVHREKEMIKEIHFRENSSGPTGLFREPFFPVENEDGIKIRRELDNDSNLARFIDYAQRTTELIKSDESEEAITTSLSEMLDACGPLEQEFYAKEMIRLTKNTTQHWNVGVSLAEKYLPKPKELAAPSDKN